MKRAEVIVLCEDKDHSVFAYRFLRRRTKHRSRVISAPSSEGSGEQFVRKQYPHQLRAIRATHVNAVLVVVIDGDNTSVAKRVRQLHESCRQLGIPPRTPQDRVGLTVPTRSIETWLRYLDGHTVNETDRYPRLERPSDCKRHVRALVEMCRSGQLRDPAPPSLAAACDEYRRVLP